MKVVIFESAKQDSRIKTCRDILTDELTKRGAQVILPFTNEELDIRTFVNEGHSIKLDADLAISIGGDGTFLYTAAVVKDSGIPILGINAGRLGFLADLSLQETNDAIKAIVENKFTIEQRSVIQVEMDSPIDLHVPYALNEIAVLKHDNSSMIEIETIVNGCLLNNYQSDGLIIATPTGSTGYSLSVGGPIIEPQSNSFVISPVASHSLTTRPVIICDYAEIELRVNSRSHNYLIAIDGRSQSVSDKTIIRLKKAKHTIGVVKLNNKHFYDILRSKLMWGADKR